jgi:hypothetical protein
MPRKPDEVVKETYEVQSLYVNPADAGGAFMVQYPDGYLDITDAKLFVPDEVRVNFWKLVQWFRTAKNVSVEVERVVTKDLKVRSAKFSTSESPPTKEYS